MLIRDAAESDLPGILTIYNDAVQHSLAIWNSSIVDLENRRAWFDDRAARHYPVLVAVDENRVLGYASFGDFRPFDGYRHTIEHSVYIHPDFQRRGIGMALMVRLIERARALGKHVMVAAIEAGNRGSIDLHQKLGFVQTGLMPEVGRKFGKWLDLLLMQLRLGAEC